MYTVSFTFDDKVIYEFYEFIIIDIFNRLIFKYLETDKKRC